MLVAVVLLLLLLFSLNNALVRNLFYPEFNIIIQCESDMVRVLSINHCPHKERQL